MGILDSILGGGSNAAGTPGSGGGTNTRMLLIMGVLAMIASHVGKGQQGETGSTGGGGLGDVLGSVLGGAGGAAAGGGLGNILGSVLGGGQGGGGGLGSILGSVLGGGQAPQAGADGSGGNILGAAGGLGGLLSMLQGGGLGDAVNSWVGNGANQPISADQVQQALGPSGHLQQLAASAGVSEGEAAQELTTVLPDIVNHLTPQGDVPEGQLDLTNLLQQFSAKLG